MSFAAIYIREFPVAAWMQNAPHLKRRPLVLLRGVPPLQKVASLNAVAHASGIEHGMSKVQAEAVCAACFRSLEPEEEKQAFNQVIALVERFSPRVQAISAPTNGYAGQHRLCVALLIDRSGTGTLFGSADDYAQRLYRELCSIGFEHSVATAPNAEAALMLARSQKGVLCVDQDSLQNHLASLSVTLLFCESKIKTLLRRWGVRTLGQLAALPETGLISRLGQQGLRLQQLARGSASHLLIPEEVEFSLSEMMELDAPAEDLEQLLFALSRLLGEVLFRAKDRACAIRSISMTLNVERVGPHIVRIATLVPTQDYEKLLELMQLELQAHPPRAAVVALRLDADAAQPQIAQHGLFQSQFPDPDRLELLVTRLQAIAGERNIGCANLSNNHREDAFTLQSFRPELNASVEKQGLVPRPIFRVLRPSQDIRVRLDDELPHVVYWQGSAFQVAEAMGPWHASGSWWDRTSFNCDYWDVVIEQPVFVLRLRHEHTTSAWNVVGLYD